jgi:MiaB/RimO family radical SAM methylthiotransferase
MSSNGNKTFYIESLGCVTNRADTARVESFLNVNGWHRTLSCDDASLIILMTCAFSKGSEDQNMNRLQELKEKKRSEAQIIVGGCLPSISVDRLREEFNGFIFSPRTLESLNAFISSEIPIENVPPIGVEANDSSITTIRISTGCMGCCTYCAIPFANGRTKSRDIESIMRDIQKSLNQSVEKIKLVSEDLGAYGHDTNKTFVQLLERIISSDMKFELYLDNLNPNWLSRYKHELMELFCSSKIVKKFSIPIQSGSNRILQLMGRGYKMADVKEIIDDLYQAFPDVKICTDFIVGFPSETDYDFEETRYILNEYPYHFLEIFTYEDRPGTKASNFAHKLSETVKEERRQILFKDFLKQFLKSNDIKNVEELKHVLDVRKGLPVHYNLSS